MNKSFASLKLTLPVMLAVGLLALLLGSGCTTTTYDPVTGWPVKTFDPVKTEKVKAALELPITGGIRRVINNSPNHSAEIGAYFAAVGRVFCSMQEQKAFDPLYLVGEINAIATPDINDETILDIKDSLISLYRIFYADRFRAELSPEKWPYHVADLMCQSIDTALLNTGQPGIR